MAKQTVVKLLDDLDGGVAHETVTFGLDGYTYQIDLSSKNAKKLRAELARYTEHGHRVSTRRPVDRDGRGSRKRGRAVADADQNRAIREWALARGLEVAARGRLRQEIVDAPQRGPLTDQNPPPT